MRFRICLGFFALAAVGAAQQLPSSSVLTVAERASFLLSAPNIQHELAMTDVQIATLSRELAHADGRRRSLYVLQVIDTKAVIQEEHQSSALLLSVLTPAQSRRLTELTRQRVGPRAISDAEIAKELGASDDVRKEVTALFAAVDAKFEEIDANIGELLAGELVSEDAAARKAAEIRHQRVIDSFEPERIQVRKDRASAEKKALELLTPDQREKWQKSLGKPYKFI